MTAVLKILASVVKIFGFIKSGYAWFKQWRHARKRKAVDEAETPGDFEDIIR